MVNIISKLKEKIIQYIEVKINLVKISVIERSSIILGYLFYSLLLLFVILATILFLGFGLSEVFAELVNSKALGYFMTLVVYIILLFILFASRRRIVRSIGNAFIRIMTEQDDDDDDKNAQDA
jgi:uncharacterized membrane protein